MGLFKKKTTSTMNQSVSTQIDPFVTNYAKGTLGIFDSLAGNVFNRNQPQSNPYVTQPGMDGVAPTGPTSFISPFSQDTTAALGQIRGFTGSGDQMRSIAGQYYSPLTTPGQIGQIAPAGQIGAISAAQIDPIQQAQASRASEFMGDYMNPYLRDVVDTSLADYDVGVDRSANAMRARRDAGTAFGDRAAIQDAIYQGEANRGRGSLAANLRSGAFQFGAQMGAGDAGRFSAASAANAASANARAAQQASLIQNALTTNADIAGRNIANQFNVNSANADIAGRNIANQMTVDQNNQANRLAQSGLSLEALRGADAATLAAMQAQLNAGQIQDTRNQAIAQEPLDLLKLRASLLQGMPYDQTVNTSGTTTGKSSGGLGFDLVSGLFNLGAAKLGR